MSDLIETVERCFDVYNRHDAAAFASFFAEDGELQVMATGEVNSGRAGIEAGADERWRSLDYRVAPSGMYQAGNDVWIEWVLTGTHIGDGLGIPASHRTVEVPGCSHMTFDDDGLIATDRVYLDFATMLRQLGVLPELEATGSSA